MTCGGIDAGISSSDSAAEKPTTVDDAAIDDQEHDVTENQSNEYTVDIIDRLF